MNTHLPQSEMTTINSLSYDIITRIGNYLPDKDLSHLVQASRQFTQALSQSLLVRALEDKPPPIVKVHALLWAIHYGHTGLVRTIVSQPAFSMYVGSIYQALYLAATLGHAEMIPLLIGAGFDVDGSDLKYPIHSAALNGHTAAVAQLLKHGARIDRRDPFGCTLLECAISAPPIIWSKIAPKGLSANETRELVQSIEAQVISLIQLLFDNGARPQLQTPDKHGDTPLHYAAFFCLKSPTDLNVGHGILRFLVEAGACLKARNFDESTPFFVSAECPTALTFFLNVGLSPNTKDIAGWSLLRRSMCSDIAPLPIVDILLRRGAKVDDITLLDFIRDAEYADQAEFDAILTLLMIHGVTFGTPSEAGQFLGYAAQRGFLPAMETVLESSPAAELYHSVPDYERAGGKGTALQWGLRSGRVDIVRFLMEKGVKMTRREQREVAALLG